MLRISQLVKRYGNGEPVLKGLDLEVPGESVVSIIGGVGLRSSFGAGVKIGGLALSGGTASSGGGGGGGGGGNVSGMLRASIRLMISGIAPLTVSPKTSSAPTPAWMATTAAMLPTDGRFDWVT